MSTLEKNMFPNGLRVLVVDDDKVYLMVLTKMLQSCHYEVTQCRGAKEALAILEKDRNKFDIIISDVHMPDMDGFKLLEIVSLKMNIPVVMMSEDYQYDLVTKSVLEGACDYLIKPVPIEALKCIWQHVVRKQNNDLKSLAQSVDNDILLRCEESCEISNGQGNEVNEETKDRGATVTVKKPRMVWSLELHGKFVAAVHCLGFKEAVPKKILELMNVKGLTRENVASHLQKYRLYVARQEYLQLHGSKTSSPQGNSQESVIFNGTSSLDSLDPQQNLAILPADLDRSNTLCVDQRKFTNYAIEESLSEIGPRPNSYGRYGNLPQQIPTMIQSDQLTPSFQSVHNFNYGATNYPLSLPYTLIDFPNAHVAKHDFAHESIPPTSFMSNGNQEYYNTDSNYEPPIVTPEDFGQSGLHIRPHGEHRVGLVESRSIYDGYPTNTGFI